MFSYLQRWRQDTERLDIVWDTYIPDSLKECAGGKKGQGVCWKVSGQTKLPGKWVDFFRDPMNKTALFAFLTCKTEEFIWPADKALYIPSGQAVSLFGSGITMGCCNHEEADAMIVVHLEHVMAQGAKTVWLWTLMTVNAASGWRLGCLWQREKVQILPYQ